MKLYHPLKLEIKLGKTKAVFFENNELKTTDTKIIETTQNSNIFDFFI